MNIELSKKMKLVKFESVLIKIMKIVLVSECRDSQSRIVQITFDYYYLHDCTLFMSSLHDHVLMFILTRISAPLGCLVLTA